MKNKQLLDAALVLHQDGPQEPRRRDADRAVGDGSRRARDSIVNSCTSFLFLPDATFNREHYRKLFSLTDHQIELFEGLQHREALYIRRDGITKVLRLNLDPRSYAAFSTKPKDRIRRARLIERYGLEEGLASLCRRGNTHDATQLAKDSRREYPLSTRSFWLCADGDQRFRLSAGNHAFSAQRTAHRGGDRRRQPRPSSSPGRCRPP